MSGTEASTRRQDAETPPLSVVMPVHNALPHLDQAIESILNQSFADFEFVILDDASIDGSRRRLKEWAARDSRIRLLESKDNLGPVGSSNMVAAAARAPFVARMDADDLSYPDRLYRQLTILHQNRDAGLVASLCDTINAAGGTLRAPEAWRLSRRSPFVPFAHGSIMYRREVFELVGGYRPTCMYWEDQDIVVRIGAMSKILVIPTPLYQVRLWTQSTRVSSDPDLIEASIDRMYRATDRLRQNVGYDDLLVDPRVQRKVDPRVFIALGSVRLWAGDTPRLWRRLITRGRLSVNISTFSALVWAAWAACAPSSLRTFLKSLLWARGVLGGKASGEDAVEWRPFSNREVAESRSPKEGTATGFSG